MEYASHFLYYCRDVIPFKFLGIPIGVNLCRYAMWNFVVDSLIKNYQYGRNASYLLGEGNIFELIVI